MTLTKNFHIMDPDNSEPFQHYVPKPLASDK